MRKKRGVSILQYGTSNPINKQFIICLSPKSFSQGFLLIFKFSENCPKTHQKFPEKNIAHELYQKQFPEFFNFPKFSENSETIMVNVRFQFCLAAESIVQLYTETGSEISIDFGPENMWKYVANLD